ncbi:MAG: acetylornithine transaminase [Rhodobiaceae bacterium]|nr:acetylornithine transaminase [Rhodobiaceae bacterium]
MNSSVMNTYNRYPVSFKDGNGAWLTSEDNRQFLDFSSGIAVNILGHNHPEINKTFEMQANKIWHVSNLYTIPEQELLAKKLCELSFAEKVFFCNSGAEAVEGAIKIARKFQSFNGNLERNEIITFKNSFHGRTLATLAAASNSLHTDGFSPIPDGFVNIPLDDDTLKESISDKTAGILIEPVQGEGGINPVSNEFLVLIRKLCDENKILMILDQVQCGMGRTGKLFSHEWSGIEPDIITLAKGLGAGFPIGAVLASEEASKGMQEGSHGSTFGGNPVGCSIALKVIELIEKEEILNNVTRLSEILICELEKLVEKHHNKISGVRGKGLMIGVECIEKNSVITDKALQNGLLLVNAANNVIRFLPPLNISENEVMEAIKKFDETLSNLDI